MLQSKILAVALLLATSFGAPSLATAEFVLEFGRNDMVAGDGGTLTTEVPRGQLFSLQIYLTQLAPETRLDVPATGLVNADFTVDVTSGGLLLNPVSFAYGPGLVDDMTNHSAISGQSVRIASAEQTGGLNKTGVTTGDSPGDNSVLIGTIYYDLDAAAEGVYTVNAQASPGGVFQFALADPLFPTPISVRAGSASLITAIPEPSFVPLMSFGIWMMASRRRGRRR